MGCCCRGRTFRTITAGTLFKYDATSGVIVATADRGTPRITGADGSLCLHRVIESDGLKYVYEGGTRHNFASGDLRRLAKWREYGDGEYEQVWYSNPSGQNNIATCVVRQPDDESIWVVEGQSNSLPYTLYRADKDGNLLSGIGGNTSGAFSNLQLTPADDACMVAWRIQLGGSFGSGGPQDLARLYDPDFNIVRSVPFSPVGLSYNYAQVIPMGQDFRSSGTDNGYVGQFRAGSNGVDIHYACYDKNLELINEVDPELDNPNQISPAIFAASSDAMFVSRGFGPFGQMVDFSLYSLPDFSVLWSISIPYNLAFSPYMGSAVVAPLIYTPMSEDNDVFHFFYSDTNFQQVLLKRLSHVDGSEMWSIPSSAGRLLYKSGRLFKFDFMPTGGSQLPSGKFTCYDATTGDELYREHSATANSSPIGYLSMQFVGDSLYVCGERRTF